MRKGGPQLNLPIKKIHFAKLIPANAAAIDPYGTQNTKRISWLLIGMVSLVLLIACADVAGLLLVRGERRQKEIGICIAIGCSRLRIFRQLLIESVLLSLAGAAAGLVLAVWSHDILISYSSDAFPVPLDILPSLLHVRS